MNKVRSVDEKTFILDYFKKNEVQQLLHLIKILHFQIKSIQVISFDSTCQRDLHFENRIEL